MANPINVDTDLLPRPGEEYGYDQFSDELKVIGDLPEVTDSALITSIIKTILGFGMSLAIIAIVVAGIYYLLARGEEEKLTKAKDILLYLVIGLVVMASAYGIITGIAKFDFFST